MCWANQVHKARLAPWDHPREASMLPAVDLSGHGSHKERKDPSPPSAREGISGCRGPQTLMMVPEGSLKALQFQRDTALKLSLGHRASFWSAHELVFTRLHAMIFAQTLAAATPVRFGS